ncbi:S8 family serine peptidase [Natronorubrum sp. A-ect3]|uniref:S8 family peptidase n=1 Tax=Natronorubrum sp. A-ect3 TaxID=3242698 RepID=UPI00359DC897
MVRKHPTRRQVLGGVATTGLTLTAISTVSASNRTRYVVTVDDADTQNRLTDDGFDITHELADGEVLIVRGDTDSTATLESISGVEAAAPDLRLEFNGTVRTASAPSDGVSAAGEEGSTLYGLQWDKHVQEVLEAHDHARGSGSTLAILDTGIDPTHPDLESNLDEDASELFAHEDADPIDDHPWDLHGHGTHVAGTAAATDDAGAEGTGITGTAPDADLVSAKVFWFEEIDGEVALMTTTADIFRAIAYSAEIGADAANMSLGTGVLPPEERAEGMHVAYQRVCQYATQQGTVVVASATNADTDLQGGQFALPTSVPGTMSISATGPNDKRTFYSNYGTGEIDVGAPGGGYQTEEKTDAKEGVEWPAPTNLVLSSVPPEVYGEPYAYFAGTSMASPQVTGLVGLVREIEPDLSANRVEQAIKHGADDVSDPGRSDPDLGAGRVNAAATLERIR